jgi:hypothetical protein
MRPTTGASLAASGAGALPEIGLNALRAHLALPDLMDSNTGEKRCLRAQNGAVN